MFIHLPFATFVSILLWTETVGSISYYVTKSGKDTNAGTSAATAWLTIQKAANSATAGSTVYVGPGIYYETVTINVQGNSKDGYITFTGSASNNLPIISGKQAKTVSADGTLNLIYIQQKSYVRLMNFELMNLTSPDCAGARVVGGGTNVELRNLLVHDIRGGGESGGAIAISAYNKDKTTSLSQLIVDNCTLHDCEPAWSEALTFSGNIQNLQVTNNRIYNMNNIGIDFAGGWSWVNGLSVTSGLCANNTVWNIHSPVDSSAAGIYVDGASNITIEFNEVYNSDMGIEVGAEVKGHIASNMTVRQNYIHNNTNFGLGFGGYDSKRGFVINSLFENNRLEKNDVSMSGSGEITVVYASGNTVRDNTVKPNKQNLVLTVDQKGGLNNTFDYDIYYPYGTGATQSQLIFYWGNTECDGLSAFQKKSKQETHAQVVNSG
ncbi:unnamed protein product [Adineta steineri]|uniref:Right handed beta helix domain-containing protein n=1 Tax=Adineta steineri TaxID=433720 RepID=A0A819H5A8_9BILA|nr:unnamed protein product [Adineta steineri]